MDKIATFLSAATESVDLYAHDLVHGLFNEEGSSRNMSVTLAIDSTAHIVHKATQSDVLFTPPATLPVGAGVALNFRGSCS